MPVSYEFSDRTAIVTGASKGIGRRIAERLRDAGAQVWNFDVTPTEVQGIRQSSVNVTDADQIACAITQLLDQTSRIDILVNNVHGRVADGRATRSCRLASDYRREPHGRVRGHPADHPDHEAQRLGPHRQHGFPCWQGWLAEPFGLLGCESRRDRLHEIPREGVGRHQHPRERRRPRSGRDRHPSTDGSGVCAGDDRKEPDERLGTVDEVAEMVLWLCSEACSFSTGAVFDVSGGRATY